MRLNKKFVFLLCFFILSFILVSFVSAQTIGGEKFVFEKRILELDFWSDLLVNLPKIIFLQDEPTTYNWLERFFVGLLAGLFMWLVYKSKIISYDVILQQDTIFKEPDDPLFKFGFSWIGLISGKLWKCFVLGVFFAIVTFIPVIGFIVHIITFDWLNISLFLKAIIVAIELGFFPTIYQYNVSRKFHKEYAKKRKKEIMMRAMLENEMRKQRN